MKLKVNYSFSVRRKDKNKEEKRAIKRRRKKVTIHLYIRFTFSSIISIIYNQYSISRKIVRWICLSVGEMRKFRENNKMLLMIFLWHLTTRSCVFSTKNGAIKSFSCIYRQLWLTWLLLEKFNLTLNTDKHNIVTNVQRFIFIYMCIISW